MTTEHDPRRPQPHPLRGAGRFDPEFVEKRRRSLSAFLSACARHPLIAATRLLPHFCEWPDALRSCVVQCCPPRYIPAAEGWSRADGGDPLKSALADIGAFEAQARKLRELTKREHVRDLERSVDQMELAQACDSFGQSDFNFTLRPMLAQVSHAFGSLSTLAKVQAEADRRTLLLTLKGAASGGAVAAATGELPCECRTPSCGDRERRSARESSRQRPRDSDRSHALTLNVLIPSPIPSHFFPSVSFPAEYTSLAGAIGEQCRRRETAAKAVDAAATELKAAQTALAKAVGRVSLEKKAADLEARAAELAGKLEVASAHLSLHTRTLSVELSRFHAEKNLDFQRALRALAAEHSATSARVNEQWLQLLASARTHNTRDAA
jgi:hypothetical protein